MIRIWGNSGAYFWLNVAIFMAMSQNSPLRGIDKNPGKCCIWILLTLRCEYSSAPLHIYLFNYNTITFCYESITILLHNAPQSSTLKALERPYRGDKWEGDIRDRVYFGKYAGLPFILVL